MSLIVKYQTKIILMTKGADSIILPRVKFATQAQQAHQLEIQKSLLTFAKEGLRTLVVGQKYLTKEQYENFEREHQFLKLSTSADKEKKLNKLYDEYEQNLDYVGSTAIEDKL